MTLFRLSCVLTLHAFVCLTPAFAAEPPSALELAAPCREAGQSAISAATQSVTGEAYRNAIDELQATVDAFVARTGESDDASLHCLNAQGATLLHLGEQAAASKVYRHALSVARAANGEDDDSTLTMQGNLAVALLNLSEVDEAKRLLEDTVNRRQSYEGTPHAHKLAFALLNLAMVEATRGDLADARAHADHAWSIAQVAMRADDRHMGTLVHDYGFVLDRVGLRSRAQSLFENSLAIREEQGDATGAVDSLASLAASFFDTGRFDESDQRYAEAYAIADRVYPALHPGRADILRSWCRVLNLVGKNQESLQRCDEAIRIFALRGEQSVVELYRTQINRGITLGMLGRADDAVEPLREAVRGLRTRLPPHNPEVLEAVRALGVVLVDAGRIEEGAEILAKSFEEQKALLGELHPDVLLAQGEYGVVLAMEGKFEASEHIISDYAQKADTMRGLYGRDERTVRGVFSRFASTRMFLAKLLIQKQRCQEAFDWIETTKARSLLDGLADRALIDTAAQADRERFGALEQVRTRLLIERAGATGDGARQTSIDVRLRAIDEDIGRIVEATRASGANSGPRAAPSQRVQQQHWGRNTALISIGLADDEVLLVHYQSPHGFQCTSLDRWEALKETIAATRALQANPNSMAGLLAGTDTMQGVRVVRTGSRSFSAIARNAAIPPNATIVRSEQEVYDVVGRELLSWLVRISGDAKHWVISSDGALHSIALDALPVDGQPLITRRLVSEVVSFAPRLDLPINHAGPNRSTTMIAFGDANYGTPGLAADAGDTARRAATLLRGSIDSEAPSWPPLPASAIEVRKLSALFHLVPEKSAFTGASATAGRLRALNRSGELGRAKYLVFSTHGIADLTNPELSSIVLSSPQGGAPRDAYVTAAELATLNLHADLVFFSACETGYGKIVAGEGVLGLSAGALTAGSAATVHTLWSVLDAASAAFTVAFFTQIRAGHSAEVALARTKREFLHRKTHANPAYWAPYVLVRTQ